MNRQPPKNPVILIPSRMASTRLPNKPLADIGGVPMIVQVLRRAQESRLGPVAVACDHDDIATAVRKEGGQAVLTKPEHPSGSDRIWEALHKLPDHDKYDAIINVQGDEPLLNPQHIRTAYELLRNPEVDIGTLAADLVDETRKNAMQVVKPVLAMAAGEKQGRALYFSRQIVPWGEGPLYHHVGMYAYRRDALQRATSAPVAALEAREKLEQLRALSMGMRIEVGIIDDVPMGVDTPEDLERARKAIGSYSHLR